MSAFLIVSQSDTKNLFQTQNDYSTFSEFRENETNSYNLIGMGRYNLVYSPNKNERWLVNTELKSNNNDIDNNIISLVGLNQVDIRTNRDFGNLKVNQILEWHKRFSQSHTTSSVISYDYQKEDRISCWETNDDILE